VAFASLYGAVVLLTLIDNNFAWDFYIVLGAVFGRFAGRYLLLLVTILFFSLCIFSGIITWPFDLSQINSIFGIGISFYGTAASAIIMQNMITERYRRNRLLTELTQAHQELSEAHQRLAETATQEQELAVLREWNRLAREMHDTLGHALVLVTVKLEIAQRLRERNPERSNAELTATQQIVRESMNELRASIANLRSPTLEHEPVSQALTRATRDMAQRTGVLVTYDLEADTEELPEQVEETLWKVGQEAIANIEKHAQANNVYLHMSRCDGRVHMRIEDDGIGLPPHCSQHKANGQTAYISPSGHYGLSGMTERIERIGGTLSLKPGTERGTVVEVVLPLVEVPLQHMTVS
jgi:signal transduction histidine kinase